MIIAITAAEKDLGSRIHGCLGRSRYVLVADTEARVVKVIDNSAFAGLKIGSGIKTAEMLIKIGVQSVVSASIGPKAEEIFRNSGVRVYKNVSGTIEEILEHLTTGGSFD